MKHTAVTMFALALAACASSAPGGEPLGFDAAGAPAYEPPPEPYEPEPEPAGALAPTPAGAPAPELAGAPALAGTGGAAGAAGAAGAGAGGSSAAGAGAGGTGGSGGTGGAAGGAAGAPAPASPPWQQGFCRIKSAGVLLGKLVGCGTDPLVRDMLWMTTALGATSTTSVSCGSTKVAPCPVKQTCWAYDARWDSRYPDRYPRSYEGRCE